MYELRTFGCVVETITRVIDKGHFFNRYLEVKVTILTRINCKIILVLNTLLWHLLKPATKVTKRSIIPNSESRRRIGEWHFSNVYVRKNLEIFVLANIIVKIVAHSIRKIPYYYIYKIWNWTLFRKLQN